jgi:chromosome segregation ATPase
MERVSNNMKNISSFNQSTNRIKFNIDSIDSIAQSAHQAIPLFQKEKSPYTRGEQTSWNKKTKNSVVNSLIKSVEHLEKLVDETKELRKVGGEIEKERDSLVDENQSLRDALSTLQDALKCRTIEWEELESENQQLRYTVGKISSALKELGID